MSTVALQDAELCGYSAVVWTREPVGSVEKPTAELPCSAALTIFTVQWNGI